MKLSEPAKQSAEKGGELNTVEVSKPVEESPKKSGESARKPEQQTPNSDSEAQGRIKMLEDTIEDWKRAWKDAEKGAESWKRGVRRELEGQNQTVLATERENIRRELDEEIQKSLAVERRTVRANAKHSLRMRLVVRLKSQENQRLQRLHRRAISERVRGKKPQIEWNFEKKVSELETRIRTRLQKEFHLQLSTLKTEFNDEHVEETLRDLEPQIRTRLQSGFQLQLSTIKTEWEAEQAALLRPQLETSIRDQLQNENNINIANLENRGGGSTETRSAEDDMLLASLSRESDETHELFQEIGRVGIPCNSAAYAVLQGLNQAKDAIYEVKCKLRRSDAVADKNDLLSSVTGLYINEHYIRQLDPATQGVLIRQANEANMRLGYLQQTLATNDDVPQKAMLRSLLEPLKTEVEHQGSLVPSQMANDYGSFAAPGTSAFPPNVNGHWNATGPSTSGFTPVNGSSNSVAANASAFPLTFNDFGNATAPGSFGVSANNIFNRQTDTQGDQSPPPATEDHSGVIGLGFVPSRPRQAKKPQDQQRGSANKGRQLAHQAFAKKQNASASMSAQAQQGSPQEQVPGTQKNGSGDIQRPSFTLEPNHAFGE